MKVTSGQQPDLPLAIVCGGGSLPFAVAEAVLRQGRPVVLFPIEGFTDPAAVVRYPHHWIAMAQFGRFRRLARREGCRDVAVIGHVVRPPLMKLRMDWLTLKLLPRGFRIYRGGDNHLLSGLAQVMAELGFRLIGAHEVAPEILMPRGNIGTREPAPRDVADIARGLALLRAVGPFDVGQAVVPALELVGQPGVVDAQAVQQGGVQIVHMHPVADDVVAVVVGLAKGHAASDSGAGQPDGVAAPESEAA